MSVKIIPDTGALLIEEGSKIFLVIADLHFKEESDKVYDIIDKVKELLKKHECTDLIVLGDIYHFQTGGEHVDFFDEELSKMVKIYYVQGNHDLPVFHSLVRTNNYVFMHGDVNLLEKIDENKTLILAHTHPYYKDRRVFVIGRLKNGQKFYLMPVFNTEQLGPDIREKQHLIGFVFEKELIKKEETIVYNLKGRKILEWKNF